MKCSKCGNNEVFLEVEEAGERLALCKSCASELGMLSDFDPEDFFDVLLEDKSKPEVLECPSCGNPVRLARSKGFAGCAQCYEIFYNHFSRHVDNNQVGRPHRGRIPFRLQNIKSILDSYKNYATDLENAIREERYEDAAELQKRFTSENEGGAV